MKFLIASFARIGKHVGARGGGGTAQHKTGFGHILGSYEALVGFSAAEDMFGGRAQLASVFSRFVDQPADRAVELRAS